MWGLDLAIRSQLYVNRSDSRRNFGTSTPGTESSRQESSINNITLLQSTVGNPAVIQLMKSNALRAEMKVSKPTDKHELEADHITDQVIRMPETEICRRTVPEEKDGIQ